MPRPLVLLLRLIGFLGCVACLAWLYWPSDFPTGAGVRELTASKVSAPPKYALHVLFVGNSYTFFHDIPGQLAAIASADPAGDTQFFVQAVTRGGIGLKELWADGDAARLIQQQHWDYVVLQEQSFWAMNQGNIQQTYGYAKRFNDIIAKSGAQTMLYLTWVRKPGSHWYTDGQTPFLQSPDYMFSRFFSVTHELAGSLGASTADVGLYWQYALSKAPEIEMYEPDATHPSVAGSYLAALVFYKTLTGHDVTKIAFAPRGIPPETAQKLKGIVFNPASP